MNDYELYPEISIVVTGYSYQPAEPENGIMSGYIDEVYFEARDSNDGIIKSDELLDWAESFYKDELNEIAEKMIADAHESAEGARAEYYEGLMEERRLGI